MNMGTEDTDRESSEHGLSWNELSDPVRDMVLVRLEELHWEARKRMADSTVASMIMRQTMGRVAAKMAQASGGDLMSSAAGLHAATDAMVPGIAAECALLVGAIEAAMAHLQERPGNGASAAREAWFELCAELDLGTDASPLSVLEMVRRLKSRNG